MFFSVNLSKPFPETLTHPLFGSTIVGARPRELPDTL